MVWRLAPSPKNKGPGKGPLFNEQGACYSAAAAASSLTMTYWRPPRPRKIPVAGRSGVATIRAQLVNLRDGGMISAHDFLIASRIAEAVCGGDVDAGSLVDENWLLALERRAFVELLGKLGVESARRVLVLVSDQDDNLSKSARNLGTVIVSDIQNINIYNLLTCDHLVATPDTLKALEKQITSEAEAA